MYCVKCGLKNKDGAKYCVRCGALLQMKQTMSDKAGTDRVPPTGEDSEDPKKKKWLLPLIIVIIIAAALVVGFFLVKETGLLDEWISGDVSEEISEEEEEDDLSAEEDETAPEEDDDYELTFETTSLTLTKAGEISRILYDTNIENLSEIVWTSSDESVVTVDENGYVTAVGSGEAIVSASREGLSAECTVTCEIESDSADSTEGEEASASVLITGVSASASSQLSDQYGKNYSPANLFDGDISTAYVEGVTGVGTGETITIVLDGEYYIDRISWYPGYQASADLLAKNGYPTRLTFSLADGTAVDSECVSVTGVGTCVAVRINADEPTDRITVVIADAVSGNKYDDTCISEIEIYGRAAD